MTMLDEDLHTEYKNDFQLLQHLLDAHPRCHTLQPNRSMQSMTENVSFMIIHNYSDLDHICVLHERVYRYFHRDDVLE